MVGSKIISVSLPPEDRKFCTSRNLSPSKLLQERISQIRDENNPSLIKNLKSQMEHSKNLARKIAFMAERMGKLTDVIYKKMPEKEADEILEKI